MEIGARISLPPRRNIRAAELWIAVLRIDLEGDKDVPVLVPAGGSFGEMGLDREPASGAGNELIRYRFCNRTAAPFASGVAAYQVSADGRKLVYRTAQGGG